MKVAATLCVTAALLFVACGEETPQPEPQHATTGKLPPSGSNQCVLYNRGGTTHIHYYACCNFGDNNKDCPPGFTYQYANPSSSPEYCQPTVPGGNIPQGGGNVTTTIYNTNCAAAKSCDQYCGAHSPTTPGTCFRYTKCFRNCLLNGGATKSRPLEASPENTSFTCTTDTCYDPATQVCSPDPEYGCTCSCDGGDGPSSSDSC